MVATSSLLSLAKVIVVVVCICVEGECRMLRMETERKVVCFTSTAIAIQFTHPRRVFFKKKITGKFCRLRLHFSQSFPSPLPI